MKEYDFTDIKWVFNVEENPDLARAILRRLEELGCEVDGEDRLERTGKKYYLNNVSVGWAGTGIAHVGACHAREVGKGEIFHGFKLRTLRELFSPYIERLLSPASQSVIVTVQVGNTPPVQYYVSSDVEQDVQADIEHTIDCLNQSASQRRST